MGHMAHVSGLSDGGNWGIHIDKEPHAGATLATAPGTKTTPKRGGGTKWTGTPAIRPPIYSAAHTI